MIEPTSNLTPMPAGTAANATSAAAPGGFVLALGAFLDASAPPKPVPTGIAARQDDAADGKDMPDEGGASQDEADDAVSIWMPPPAPFAVPPTIADAPAPSTLDGTPEPLGKSLIALEPAALASTQTQIPAARSNSFPDAPVSDHPIEARAANATLPIADAAPAAAKAPSALPVAAAVASVAENERQPSSAQIVLPAAQRVPGDDRPAAPIVPPRVTTTSPRALISTLPFEQSGDVRRFSAVSPGQRNPVTERTPGERATPTPTALASASAPVVQPARVAALAVSNTASVTTVSPDTGDAPRQHETGRPSAADSAGGSIPLPVARATFSPVGTVQPARQAFAAALSALAVPRRTRGQMPIDSDPLAASAREFATPGVSTTAIAAAPSQDAALDVRQDPGLARMLDHIERLRDDADASDTRIRLVPDALGTVDVAVRKDGEAVHVHFTAASETTRAAIADAQPRLADLAESRGVKIAGSSIDAGAGGQDRPTPQPRSESLRPAPATALSAVAPDSESTNDQRLA